MLGSLNKAGKNDLSEANIAGKKSNDSSHDDDGNREFSKVDVVDAEVDDNKGKEGCHASGKIYVGRESIECNYSW